MTQEQDDCPDDLVNSIRTHAICLERTDPETQTDGAPSRVSALNDVAIVGMGEATHRTREFAQYKHRLVRRLVRVHGFRLFGLEAQFSEARALHDYVVYGAGDVESALNELVLDIHRTEEMVHLLRWMREFNDGRTRSDRISVYGFDIQSPSGAAASLREYFEGIDTESSPTDATLSSLATLEAGIFDGYDVKLDRLRTAERVVPQIATCFESEPDRQPLSPGTDRALARQHLRVLRWGCRFARAGIDADRNTQHGVRDRHMARTVEWVMDYEPFDEIALWAHNNHVKRGELCGTDGSARTMGDHLAQRYGPRYYALGFQLGGGTIRGLSRVTDKGTVGADDEQLRRRELSIPNPPAESVPALFARTDTPVLFLDYRSVPDGSCLGEWLAMARPHLYVAGVVDPNDLTTFYQEHASSEEFDGLVFVREGRPTSRL